MRCGIQTLPQPLPKREGSCVRIPRLNASFTEGKAPMKLFLDSAKVDEIRHALEMWGSDGVTTNPRHVKTAGKPFRTVILEIAELMGDDAGDGAHDAAPSSTVRGE